MTLGEKVHLLRRRRNLTQQDLGQAAQIHVNTIARIERDEIRDPSGQMILRLAEALGTSTDYLLGRTEDDSSGLWPPGVAFHPRATTPADTGCQSLTPHSV